MIMIDFDVDWLMYHHANWYLGGSVVISTFTHAMPKPNAMRITANMPNRYFMNGLPVVE
jgi:hypothetical protein